MVHGGPFPATTDAFYSCWQQGHQKMVEAGGVSKLAGTFVAVVFAK